MFPNIAAVWILEKHNNLRKFPINRKFKEKVIDTALLSNHFVINSLKNYIIQNDYIDNYIYKYLTKIGQLLVWIKQKQ